MANDLLLKLFAFFYKIKLGWFDFNNFFGGMDE